MLRHRISAQGARTLRARRRADRSAPLPAVQPYLAQSADCRGRGTQRVDRSVAGLIERHGRVCSQGWKSRFRQLDHAAALDPPRRCASSTRSSRASRDSSRSDFAGIVPVARWPGQRVPRAVLASARRALCRRWCKCALAATATEQRLRLQFHDCKVGRPAAGDPALRRSIRTGCLTPLNNGTFVRISASITSIRCLSQAGSVAAASRPARGAYLAQLPDRRANLSQRDGPIAAIRALVQSFMRGAQRRSNLDESGHHQQHILFGGLQISGPPSREIAASLRSSQ